MRSIKTKLFSLGLAASMLLALAGCNLSTPASVGSIGGVDIPAGIYLLAQYNAYNTASGLADLATGETASDVKAVLKAECTGTIGDEEVTATGEEYVRQLTMRALEYYAAVEKQFAELGATLEDAATAEAADSAASLWASNGDLYAANGIGQASLEAFLLNAQKAEAIERLLYGPDGSQTSFAVKAQPGSTLTLASSRSPMTSTRPISTIPAIISRASSCRWSTTPPTPWRMMTSGPRSRPWRTTAPPS